MKILSIIIPVYNEENTVAEIVRRVQKVDISGVEKEIVLVNDGSSDGTKEIIKKLEKAHANIVALENSVNMGKGAALRKGFKTAKGDFIIIQDSDLEYNPEDFKRLIIPLLHGEVKVVYGSRMLGQSKGFKIASHYYGNKFLSFLTMLFYGQKITDMETCYKMFARDVIKDLSFKSNGFDIEPEITTKIMKKRYKIKEIPIDYQGRSFEEGKKITWKDGIAAIYTILKYRFFD